MTTVAEVTVTYALLRIAEIKAGEGQQIPLCGNCGHFESCRKEKDIDEYDFACPEYRRREDN